MERIAVLFRRTPDSRPNPVKGGYTALAIFLPLIVLALLGQKDIPLRHGACSLS